MNGGGIRKISKSFAFCLSKMYFLSYAIVYDKKYIFERKGSLWTYLIICVKVIKIMTHLWL